MDVEVPREGLVGGCRAYHFEFSLAGADGVVDYRYPSSGELLSNGEAECSETWDARGLALVKRFNDPMREDIDVELDLQICAINTLELADTSRRQHYEFGQVVLDHSVAVGESLLINATIDNLGLVAPNATSDDQVRVAVQITCTTPGSLDNSPLAVNDALIEDIELNWNNATFFSEQNEVGSDVGTFVPDATGLGGVWTTRFLVPGERSSIEFKLTSTPSTATGLVTCTALTLEVLSESFQPLVEPELFCDAANVTDFAQVGGEFERRTDVALSWQLSDDDVLAGGPPPSDRATVTLTIVNNGPLPATELSVVIKTPLDVGHVLVSTTIPPAAAEHRSANSTHWHIGTLAVGESRSVSLTLAATAAAAEGDGLLEALALVGTQNIREARIFMNDDKRWARINVHRRIDLRVKHGLKVIRAPHNDYAELSVVAENLGVSDSAVVTLIVVVGKPDDTRIAGIKATKGRYIKADPDVKNRDIYERRKDWPVGTFHYWVIGKIPAGGREILTFAIEPTKKHREPGTLQLGAAIDEKRLIEKDCVNIEDDYLYVSLTL